MIEVFDEKMSEEFSKHHLKGFPFDAVIHHFTAPDTGFPHNHPFAFTSHVLKGSYVERRYGINKRTGHWACWDIKREAGTSFRVEADTIHEIIDLPEGECYTLILPEKKIQEPGFFKFEPAEIRYRQWDGEWHQLYYL